LKRTGFFLSAWVFIFCSNVLRAQTVAINEVMASNDTTLADMDGHFEDWIELYNYGTDTVHLTGFGLSDRPANKFRWVFPAISLAPGDFVLIWASGKDRTQGPELHCNFSISASGEPVLLTAPSGVLVDSMAPVAIPTDVSYGRQPDGTGGWFYFYDPTPGSVNTTAPFQTVLTPPDFSVPSGFYQDTVLLAISHPDPDAVIVYTLDGSMPDINNLTGRHYVYKNQYRERAHHNTQPLLNNTVYSFTYQGPMELANRSPSPNLIANKSMTFHHSPNYLPGTPVKKAQVVRARIYKNGVGGPVTTHNYFISNQQQFESDLPIIAISTDADRLFDYYDGIMVAGVDFESWRATTTAQPTAGSPANYRRTGRDQEPLAHFEYFVSNQSVLSQNVGMRIHGGFARAFYPKSIRLYARNVYGQQTLDYPFFSRLPHTSFRRLLLRNSGQDYMNTYFRDAFIQHAVRHLGFDYQEYEPAVMYLNGEYWGLTNIRERIDANYLNRRYGLDPGEVDLLDHNALVMAGDSMQFIQMRTWIGQANLQDDTVFAQVSQKIDLQNFTDYYISQIFINNTDWPGGNIRYFRKRVPFDATAAPGHDGRWRWIMFDTDFGFGRVGATSFNTLAHATAPTQTNWANYPESTVILRSLLQNDAYKTFFINRFADLLNTTFKPSRMIGLIDSIADVLADDHPDHQVRWNLMQNWLGQIQVMQNFAQDRPFFQRGHLMAYFSLQDTLTLTLDISHANRGFVKVNTVDIHPLTPGVSAQPYPWAGVYFRDMDIALTAIPEPGFRFSHWSGSASGTDPNIVVRRSQSFSVTAHFEPLTPADELLHFWVFDRQLPNDAPLEQVHARYSAIGRLPSLNFLSCLPGYPYQPGHPDWRRASMERRNSPTDLNYRPIGNNGVSYPQSDMRGLQIRPPYASGTSENQLHMAFTTVGYKDIQVSVAALTEDGPYAMLMEYWDTATTRWVQTGMPLSAQFLDTTYSLLVWDFRNVAAAINNGNFQVRLRLLSTQPELDDGSRVTINNVAIEGNPLSLSFEESTPKKTTLQVWPNPATDQVHLSLGRDAVMGKFQVIDAYGRLVYAEEFSSPTSDWMFSVAGWSTGTYFVMVADAGDFLVRKLVVR
jgi:hypothetical protein